MVERFKEDRFVRWSTYAAAPCAWLALALFNPLFLVVAALLVFALWKAIGYGMVERYDAPPDLDLL